MALSGHLAAPENVRLSPEADILRGRSDERRYVEKRGTNFMSFRFHRMHDPVRARLRFFQFDPGRGLAPLHKQY